MNVDIELIKKYDKPGPRYTSYPTAPQFHENFTAEDYANEIELTNSAENPPDLSLYFHIPFCDTLCYFCGCNMSVTRNRERIQRYVDYLKQEIDLVVNKLITERRVVQLHWGGGTPTHLDPHQIRNLLGHINDKFFMTHDSENSCEIDPRELTKEHLLALREGGMNRISMGVQDFNKQVQKAVNRIQTEEVTRRAIEWIRELNFDSLNLDLMYGLPHQSAAAFEKTVDTIIDIAPERIATFNFAYLPWFKRHMQLIKKEDLPTPEEKLEIFKMTMDKLTDAGYVFIGMDHFAKPDDELAVALREKQLYRNFQGYSTHSGTDIIAMGITSISQIGTVYAQNYKTENEYYDALEAEQLPVFKGFKLDDDDILRREVIMKIMCNHELHYNEIEDEFKINFKEYFAIALSKMTEFINDDLVILDNDKLTITEQGTLFIRNIAMNFDGFIERKEDQGKYSRTV